MKTRVGCLALALGSLASLALGGPQDSDTLERIDGLLLEMGTPSLAQLFEDLGPVPPLGEVLQPLETGFVPIMERRPGPEVSEVLGDLRREFRETPTSDLETRLAITEERELLLAESLGDQHPLVKGEAKLAQDFMSLLELSVDDRELLLEVRRTHGQAVLKLRSGEHLAALDILGDLLETEWALMGDRGRLSSVLASIVVVSHSRGDYARAERAGRAALGRAMVEFGLPHANTTKSLNSLAQLETQLGRLEPAAVLHAHSVSMRRALHGDQGAEFALSLMHLVDFLRLRNDVQGALAACNTAIEILRRESLHPDRLGILLAQRGTLRWSLGDDLGARESLIESVELLEATHDGDHPELVNAIGILADLERSRGEHEVALEYAIRSREMVDRLHRDPHPLAVHSRWRLGACYEVLDQLDEAELAYRSAIAAHESLGAESSTDLVLALDGLAAVLARRGDLAGSEAVRGQVAEQWQDLQGRSRLAAAAWRKLAEQRAALGRLPEAIQAQGRALEIYLELLGKDHVRVLIGEVALAELLLESGETDQARLLVEGVLERSSIERVEQREAVACARLLAARLALDEGELTRATRWANACLEARQSFLGVPHADLIEAHTWRGRILERCEEFEGAAFSYSAALEQADALRAQVLGDERDRALYAGELSLGSLARSLARVRLAANEVELAFEASERGRERALLDLLERSQLDLMAAARAAGEVSLVALEAGMQGERLARRELQRTELELQGEVLLPETSAERVIELEGRVREARRILLLRQGELEAWLRSVWPSARTLPLDEIIAGLREDEVMLHYTFDDAGVGLIALVGGEPREPMGFELARGPGAASALRADLLSIGAAAREGRELEAATLERLSRTLIPPSLWPLLLNHKRLVIVPDGPLHELPFEWLATPMGPWLSKGPRLIYSPSATLFARRRAAGRGEQLDQGGRAVVLGDPRFQVAQAEPMAGTLGGESRSSLDNARLFGARLSPLPGSGVEARRVAAGLRSAGWEVDLLLQDHAGSEALFERAGGASLLHLATHGLAPDAARPYDAALALTCPGRVTPADDGFLTLEDLVREWRGTLGACDLVVLSACDTQAGVPLGESRVALSWGFFFAGAESVLVSFWKVDDGATLLLMDRFYSSYTGKFEGRREAGGESFEGGTAIPEDAALHEAKAWLARSTPEQNRQRLEALGFLAEDGEVQRDFPRPGAKPSSRVTREPFDFRGPRFGSAFALYGQPD